MTPKKLSNQKIAGLLRRTRNKDSNLKQLLKKVIILEDKNCWTIDEDWTKYKFYNNQPLHRFIFRLFNADIVGKNIICHHCDRPGCFNPSHLYQGTPKTNFNDAIIRGRMIRSHTNNRISSIELEQLKELDRRKNLQLPPEYIRANRIGFRRRSTERIKFTQS